MVWTNFPLVENSDEGVCKRVGPRLSAARTSIMLQSAEENDNQMAAHTIVMLQRPHWDATVM